MVLWCSGSAIGGALMLLLLVLLWCCWWCSGAAVGRALVLCSGARGGAPEYCTESWTEYCTEYRTVYCTEYCTEYRTEYCIGQAHYPRRVTLDQRVFLLVISSFPTYPPGSVWEKGDGSREQEVRFIPRNFNP